MTILNLSTVTDGQTITAALWNTDNSAIENFTTAGIEDGNYKPVSTTLSAIGVAGSVNLALLNSEIFEQLAPLGMCAPFAKNVVPNTNYWHPCDGTAIPGGGGISGNAPDINSAPTYVRGATSYGGETPAGANTHNHTGTATATGALASVQSGGGGTIADQAHTHPLAISSSNHEPQHIDLVWFIKYK